MTTAMASGNGCRSSTGCCVTVTGGRWRSRRSKGHSKDSKTLPSQVNKLEQRFGLDRVIVVTDRGIGTKENVTLLAQTAQYAFVTALKAPQIRALVKEGCLQLSMFDELNLAEIACEKLYPGQRLVVCRNPLVAEERARKRSELLAGTEEGSG